MPKSKRVTPEIPSASMADIAFMLLIFFLVATQLKTDTGLTRMLPPWLSEDMPDPPPIKERNVFVVLINKDDKLMVEKQPLKVEELREKAKEFIANPYDLDDLPEKKVINIDYFGNYRVSKGIISLQNDRGTSYDMYIRVQNELIAAYNELRDELAMKKFGQHFEDLPEDKQDAIKKVYPQVISEAEPKNIGGI